MGKKIFASANLLLLIVKALEHCFEMLALVLYLQTNEVETSLNKYISETGFCSRREADNYIEQGRVTINGNIASKGNRVGENDVVHIDDEILKKRKSSAIYIVLNKPKGITCTTDQKDKTNIIDFVNFKKRIFPV
ncbi:MAG TPA: S4 domain-containing protein, partial [Ignavibacteriaceae bacterium]